MELNSTQFWERLEQTGLVTPEQATLWREEIERSVGAANLLQPNKIASELIRTGRITPFQFNALLEPTVPRLRVGPYLLRDTLSDRLGPGWHEAIESIRGTSKWAYVLTPDQLASDALRSNPPSVELGRLHARLEAPGLDRWESILLEPGILAAFSDPAAGRSLSQEIESAPVELSRSIAIVRSIAQSLEQLHANQLVHGWLTADSVWVVPSEDIVLRRDPIYPPCSPYYSESLSCLTADSISRFGATAPELTLPEYRPDAACDIYALGVLWATILSGKSPWENASRLDKAGWRKTHQQVAMSLPSEIPESIGRCIRHLVAKNRQSRFPSIAAFLKQLEAITPLHPRVQSSDDSASKPIAPTKEVATPQPSNPAPVIPATTPATPSKPNPAQSDSLPAKEKASGPSATPTKPAASAKAVPVAKAVVPTERSLTERSSASTGEPAPSQSKAKEADTATPAKPTPPKPMPTPSTATTSVRPAAAVKSGAAVASPVAGSRAALVKKKKKRKPKWVIPALGVGSIALLGGLIAILLQSGGGPVSRPEPDVKIVEVPANSGAAPSSKPAESNAASSDPLAEFFNVVADDGASLWAPPHAGVPYSLDMLPPGPETLVFFSKAAWMGEGAFQAIQPWVLEALPAWKQLVGSVPFAKDQRISQVAMGLYPSLGSGSFEFAFRFSLESPSTIESLIEGLPGFAPNPSASDSKQGFWSSGEWAIAVDELSIDKTQSTRRLTVAPKKLMDALVEIGGRSVPLRRQMDMLLQSSDSRSDLFVLAAPSFLLGDGRGLFSQSPRFQPIAKSLWGDDVQAVSFACSVSPRFYGEWRAAISDTTMLGRRAAEWKQALEKSPDYLEQQWITSPPPAYWRAIALRMPQMVRALVRSSRFGLEEGQIISNVYLPPESLENLTVGVWMSLQEGGEVQTATVAQPKPPAMPSSAEDLMERPMSISFEQESLEMGLAAIATEFNDSVLKGAQPLAFTINGAAFQKEGITQNQQVRGFSQSSAPLRKVLTDLVRRANPVTTVQSATEKDQKVVWVLLDDPSSSGGKRVELTTRTWAEANGATLPKEFLP